MNALSDVALVFGTMDRPQAVQRFVFSIRKRFPNLSIHAADQTEPTRHMRTFYERHGVHVVWMPHDVGVSACRNELVRRTSEKYLFVCDDDLIFDADTDPTGCLEILKRDPEIGIVGGRWIDEYDGQPGRVRQWALYLALDRKNRILTGIPAYHFVAEFRHVGVYKYFLCDTALNFALFRREVFDDEAVRWDTRFKCNGEHEDFYLNLKTRGSDYRVAYHPGLVCRHRRPRAPAYERLRGREDGWRAFMEKWSIDQYCEIDNGTRTVVEPGKVHADRRWSDYLSGVDLSSHVEVHRPHERGIEAYGISLTSEMQVIKAHHYDPETGDLIPAEPAPDSLHLTPNDELHLRRQ